MKQFAPKQPKREEEQPVRRSANAFGDFSNDFGGNPSPNKRIQAMNENIQRVNNERNARRTQPKLTIGAPNDKYEKDADRTAELVMSKPNPEPSKMPRILNLGGLNHPLADISKKELLQRLFAPETVAAADFATPSKNAVQRQERAQNGVAQPSLASPPTSAPAKRTDDEEAKKAVQKMADSTVQGKAITRFTDLEATLRASYGGGQPMPEELRIEMETRFGGLDFSHVRIHIDGTAQSMCVALHARAFTSGSHIYFNAGEWDPASKAGKTLLAHELTHTVHQGVTTGKIQREAQGDEPEVQMQAEEADVQMMAEEAVQKQESPDVQETAADVQKMATPEAQQKADVQKMEAPGVQKQESPDVQETAADVQKMAAPEAQQKADVQKMAAPGVQKQESPDVQMEEEPDVQEQESPDVQGKADVQRSSAPKVQKAPPPAQPVLKPTTPLDITHKLSLTDEWAKYLDAENAKKAGPREVDVKIGERYYGTIELSRKKGTDSGELARYEITKGTKKKFLKINGWNFLQPLRDAGIETVLVLNNFGDEQVTTGFLSVAIDGVPVGNAKGFIDSLNKNLDKMGFLGIKPITITDGFENEFSAGRLIFQVGTMKTVVDGYLEAGGGMGITGDVFTFNVNANIDVAGLASGEFMIARGEDGSFSGTADISADIANVNAKLHVEYINGAVTIQGTGRIESEKFSGEITLLVTDAERSTQMMHAALGVESMDAEKEKAAAPTEPKAKTKGNQVLAGWGEITANITPWLSGTAKVGIDAEGHVTIVGEITVPQEVELMEQRGKKVDIFKVEIRAGYGIPLVGQVFLFASIGMFMNAGFGPLVLKGVGFKGTYSTDPNVLQEFEITGTLGINAFAILGLEAEAGVGLTLLGHDLKAGVNVTAAAGLRAYAEATPTLQYKEQAAPEGGKMGETRLKGHFEAAAQLFMQLSGSLFYELDSPWWSPAPDGREDFPLGEVQYPIGPSMGIGADMDWLVGSGDIPEVKFSPVEFDPDKFTADVMADPPPRKSGKAESDEKGEWVDGNPPGDKKDDPTLKDGEGLPDTGKKKEDLKKLPDEEKYMRSLDEMAKLEKADPKPTFAVLKAKAAKVKAAYGLDQIKTTDNGETGEVFVKHAKQDNGDHILEIPLMSAAERYKLLKTAMDDLKVRNSKAGGEEGTITENEAKELITSWHKAHPVVEEVRVVDGETTWDYFIDIGDKSETEKGKGKKDEGISPEDVAKHEKIAEEIHEEIRSFRTVEEGQTLEELEAKISQKAEELKKIHSPKLKDGIGLFIVIYSENGAINVHVTIKPNDTDKSYKVLPKIGSFNLFDLYVEMALSMATDEMYKAGNKPATTIKTDNFEEVRDTKIESSRGFEGATDAASEKLLMDQERQKKLEKIEQELKHPIEKIIAQLQTDYHLAFKAKYLGNNIMSFAGVSLFIDQARNYYVYPMSVLNQKAIVDSNGKITVPKEVPGFEYSQSHSTLSNWVNTLNSVVADSSYVDHEPKKIAFMIGGLGAEPHRYAPNHITHLIAIARLSKGGTGSDGEAVNVLHLEGTKDPVATGEIKQRLRIDRLNVIKDNPELSASLEQIYNDKINIKTGSVDGHYLLDGNQKTAKNGKQFELANNMKEAIIKYIRSNG